MHAGEPLDVLPRIRQCVAGPGERNRRREHKQGDFVVGDALQVVDERAGADRVSLFAPRRDGLDVAAVFVGAMFECRTRSSEMAADRIGAARAVGPFGGDHRQCDVCPRVVWIFGDRCGEGDRRAVLHREQPANTLGVRGCGTN